ncbi:hypothetical protein ITP53_08055 [Nonomuraea sp. K274]|uniref:Uncharacterized protein n=1 Tax=Nonomuraea cypriaca TaxID=1187855 RepID=A0A931EYY7_9ACTN|nr:hypothetical protein [Nonomuraea cypriaca]MBF8185691.1 hypothetical protein [Nonomuraea cypriaca]
MSNTAARPRLLLADEIESAGWRKALEVVPRERFLGNAVYLPDQTRGDLWTPVRRADMSTDDWLALAYANETWVTLVAGILAEDATGIVTGIPGRRPPRPAWLYGYAENAEYDRLIATCSVRTIPLAWTRQVRTGGTITAPMGGWMGGVAFAHLSVDHDGTASGRFLKDDLYFMTARSHLPPPRPPMVEGIGDSRGSRIDPSLLQDNQAAAWVAQLAVPQAQHSWNADTTFLIDVGTGSRADASPDPAGGWTVHQHGRVRLWDEIETAIEISQKAGRPHQSGFGLTVTRERQWVWLGDQDGPSWELPA